MMNVDIHWLACYVQLPRATDLDGLLILRLATREQLTRGAPEYLKAEMQRLAALEKESTSALKARIAKLHKHLSEEAVHLFHELFRKEDRGLTTFGLRPVVSKAPVLDVIAQNVTGLESQVDELERRVRLRKKSRPSLLKVRTPTGQLSYKRYRLMQTSHPLLLLLRSCLYRSVF